MVTGKQERLFSSGGFCKVSQWFYTVNFYRQLLFTVTADASCHLSNTD